MLQQFFAFFITFIILFIVFIIINLAIPIWRFIVRADSVIQLYGLFKDKFSTDFSKEEKIIEISYGKYTLSFANTDEASIEFEKLANDALEYYDKLGWIADVDDTFKTEKDELIQICNDVRMLRWNNQGV